MAVCLEKMMVLRKTTKMFSATEVSRLAGFEKPWMLNHLERESIFVSDKTRLRQHGKGRKYTYRDLIILRAINRLLVLGARPKRLKKAIDTFASACPFDSSEDELLSFARRSAFFVVSQTEVLFASEVGELVDLAKGGQLAFSFMVDNAREIGPAIEASLHLLNRVREGQPRTRMLVEQVAKKYAL